MHLCALAEMRLPFCRLDTAAVVQGRGYDHKLTYACAADDDLGVLLSQRHRRGYCEGQAEVFRANEQQRHCLCPAHPSGASAAGTNSRTNSRKISEVAASCGKLRFASEREGCAAVFASTREHLNKLPGSKPVYAQSKELRTG
jgi:hypothetical protein